MADDNTVVDYLGVWQVGLDGDTASMRLASSIVLDWPTQTAVKQPTPTTETAACKPHKFETMTRPVTNMI